MANLKALISLLMAIPDIYKIIMSVWDLFKQEQIAKQEKKRLEAIEAMKNAQTIEEVKDANRDITNNLP